METWIHKMLRSAMKWTERQGQMARLVKTQAIAGKIKAVTLEEEDKLLKYYAGKIQSICQALQLPDKVRATALTYLKRAYLSFSVLDHNPKDTMLACIYLAGKVEENYIGAEEFCKMARQDESVLLRGEILLLEALGFDLLVYSPYRPLQGLMIDLEAMPTSHHAAQGDPERCLDGVRRKAIVAADALMLTDAPLLFPPGQLALAALRSGVRSTGGDFEPMLKLVVEKCRLTALAADNLASPKEALLEQLQHLDAFGVQGASPINDQEVRKIDKKLLHCHNLLLNPSSRQYQDAAAQQRDKAAQRKATKAALKRERCAAEEALLLDGRSVPLPRKHSGNMDLQASKEEMHPDTKRRRSQL